jgi:hypothetical protein
MSFFDGTHIQGAVGASVAYGLLLNGEIVAAMSFGRSRYSKKAEWELLRFSNKLHTSVVGGASRLFRHFIKEKSPTSVISYSDLRWNTGALYTKIGFTQTGVSGPNYWYTKDYKTLESRIKYQKHKLSAMLDAFVPEQTEWENMSNNGFDRIWDCGNAVFLWGCASQHV